jgi:hypothetical protein
MSRPYVVWLPGFRLNGHASLSSVRINLCVVSTQHYARDVEMIARIAPAQQICCVLSCDLANARRVVDDPYG